MQVCCSPEPSAAPGTGQVPPALESPTAAGTRTQLEPNEDTQETAVVMDGDTVKWLAILVVSCMRTPHLPLHGCHAVFPIASVAVIVLFLCSAILARNFMGLT